MKNVLSPSREGEGNNWEKSSDGNKNVNRETGKDYLRKKNV